VYFDRTAEDSTRLLATSADPGRLGRSAYHFIHPVMVAGIIVVAAADNLVLARPGAPAGSAVAWLVLGGAALFLAGHLAFKFAVWGHVNLPRAVAVGVLALLGLAAPHVSAMTLSGCAAAVVLGVTVADRVGQVRDGDGPAEAAAAQD
jgi:low temperature requirement protein LtrA